jgi:hypothetical protein
VTTAERRKRVMRAVIAVEAVPMMALPVRAYHVQHFGLPECVDERPQTIGADLRWLEGEGYLLRPNHWHAEYVSTEAGQRWAR